MVFNKIFGREEESTEIESDNEKLTGKIYHLSDEGWGFISSQDIKFTRIFFHWTGLEESTLKFTELKKGMKVEFIPVEIEDRKTSKVRTRAIHVRVIE